MEMSKEQKMYEEAVNQAIDAIRCPKCDSYKIETECYCFGHVKAGETPTLAGITGIECACMDCKHEWYIKVDAKDFHYPKML